MPRRKAHFALLVLVAALAAAPAWSQDLVGDRPSGEIAFSDEAMQLRYRDAGKNVEAGRGSRAHRSRRSLQ